MGDATDPRPSAQPGQPPSPTPGGFGCDDGLAEIEAELAAAESAAGVPPTTRGGRIHQRTAGGFTDVADTAYKGDEASGFAQIIRREIIGRPDGAPAAFHLRHFEVAPGGYSSHEAHQHIHAVIVESGRGRVIIDGETREVGPGDVVYIGPQVPHQFICPPDAASPLGFFCIVDAERDRPTPLPGGYSPGPAG
jgi:quercetin dioxygenase-like cupin family protein